MINYIRFTLILLIPFLLSCNPSVDSKVGYSIAELYNGEVSIAKGIKSSTSNGLESIFTIYILNNELIQNKWLPADAMANNCAMIAYKSRSQELDDIDLLAVEIQNDKIAEFQFMKRDLLIMEQDYDKINKVIKHFILALKDGVYEKCYELMEKSDQPPIPKEEFDSFLKTANSIVPDDFVESRVLGFRTENEDSSVRGYWVTAVMISGNGSQRMLVFKLTKINEGFSISSFTI